MSRVVYKKQSVTGLEYKLILSPESNFNFNILKNRLIDWQGVTLDFSIIGSSHFVKINTGNRNKLIELIACTEPGDTDLRTIVQQGKLADSTDYRYSRRFNSFYKYSFTSKSIEDCLRDSEEFRRKYLDNTAEIYLEYVFPSVENLAVTSIEITGGNDELSWVTYHSYPEEKMIIKTRSTLERGNGINGRKGYTY